MTAVRSADTLEHAHSRGSQQHDRSSGVLLHPTSLPPAEDLGSFDGGNGDLGGAAYRFVDWLQAAGQTLWQVLPLNPAGPGDTPYTSVSAMAGCPRLIAPAPLLDAGWLTHEDLAARADDAGSPAARLALLRIAARAFFGAAADSSSESEGFNAWCARESCWLEDYALFMALRAHQHDTAWHEWPAPLARREPAALAAARDTLHDEVRFWRFVQWNFDTQWGALRDYAHARGVHIIGDMPIYVALDSADVWAHRDAFELDAMLRPTAVAGVPPDYFSATGQLWGNPLYRWERHAADGFAWWAARLRRALAHADLVRIDHFRAFAAYWAVPSGAPDAVTGEWRPGPGRALFDALEKVFGVSHGQLPLIAEDLGTITPDVIALRNAVGLPGMCVLQFAFSGGADNLYLPHNLTEACALYTGTHDNDTSAGWFASASAHERAYAQVYLKTDGAQIGWDLIHAASASVARHALMPLQDVLCLGNDARMNRPGLADGQWGWRFAWEQVQPWHAARLRRISAAHGRNGLALEFG